MPAAALAEGLLAAFPALPRPGAEVLVAQAEAARPVLVDGLRSHGWSVLAVAAYETRPRPADADRAAELAAADAVLFAAGSAARSVLAAYGADRLPPVVVCMGPLTADAVRDHGGHVTAVADPHTLDGLVAATVTALRRAHGPH